MTKSETTGTRAARAAGLLLVLATTLIVVPQTPVFAASRCEYSDGVVHVQLARPRGTAEGTLERDSTGAIYWTDGNGRNPCGGATVLTTRRIRVKDVVRGGFTHFRLDVSEGDFARGPDEIPIRIDLGPG